MAGLGYGATNPPTNVVVARAMTRRLGFFMGLKQTGVPVGGFLAALVLPRSRSRFVAFGVGFAVLVVLVTAASTALLGQAFSGCRLAATITASQAVESGS